MRERQYLSYSQLKLFKDGPFGSSQPGPEAYYEKYLSTNVQPKEPQSLPMAIGSAFDCFAKSALEADLLGVDSRFTELFEASVEEQNRDAAFLRGHYCMEEYKEQGAYADMLQLMVGSVRDPQFEFESVGTLQGSIHAIPVMGIPDARITLPSGRYFYLDWKVNGYMSKASPKPGYVNCGGKTHKKAEPLRLVEGVRIGACGLFTDWADQLSIYAVLDGHTDGPILAGVDQLVFAPNGTEFPTCRIAQFRAEIPESYWRDVIVALEELWDRVTSDHFFRELPKSESDALCAQLDIVVPEDFADVLGGN
jgi:hypothetical protein